MSKVKKLSPKAAASMTGGAALRSWRDSNNLTQPEAGDLLGLWDCQISRYERERIKPSIETAINLEQRCGIPVACWQKQQ